MSINTIQTNAQNNNAELYKIRKNAEAQKTEQAENTAALQENKQVDKYDKANPVGEEVEGIYSVSHDDEGNVKVEYRQPAKTDSKSESKTEAKPEAAAKNAEKTGEAQNTEKGVTRMSGSSNGDDDELEKLKQERIRIRQQLSSEKDEDKKRQLRSELQSIESKILQLSRSFES